MSWQSWREVGVDDVARLAKRRGAAGLYNSGRGAELNA